MDSLNDIISTNLVYLRKKANLTQVDVAAKLKYSDKTISKWETGEIIPSVENLIQLCDIYNVSLDTITTKMNTKTELRQKDFSKRNQLIISLLAVMAVWLVATLVFVYAKIIAEYNAWKAFLWAVPCCSVVAIVFNSLWGKYKYKFIFISILIWSFIACLYFQFLQYNFISIFLIGIPVQIAVILWSGLVRTKH